MIRRAELEDIEELVKLRMALIREANHLQADEDVSEIKKNVVDYLSGQLNKTFLVWVVEEQDRIVATSGLNMLQKPPTYANPTGKEAFIMNIYVVPEARGKGCATALVKEIINYLENTECKKIQLVATDAGRYVYEKIGFKAKEAVMEYSL